MARSLLLDRAVTTKTFLRLPISTRQFPLFKPFGIVADVNAEGIAESGIAFAHVERGGTIKIKVSKPAEQYLDVVNASTPSPRLDRGTVEVIDADPAFARGHHVLTDAEANLGDVVAANASADEWNDLRGMLGGDIRRAVLETLHRWCVMAILGTATYTIDKITKSISWGLEALTPPSTPWATVATSTPLADIDAAAEEFEGIESVEVDTIILNKATYNLAKNAASTKTEIRWVEAMQAAVLRGETVLFGGYRWIMIRGKFAGVDRMTKATVVLAHLGDFESGSFEDGNPTLAFRTAKLRENEMKGGLALYTVPKKDPDEERLVASLNGIACVDKRGYVKTLDVS